MYVYIYVRVRVPVCAGRCVRVCAPPILPSVCVYLHLHARLPVARLPARVKGGTS